MKVLHLISPGGLAGAERVVLSGCAALERAGASPTLGVILEAQALDRQRPFLERAEQLGLSVHLLTSHSPVDLGLAAQLDALLRELDPELIHAHGYKALFYAHMTRSPHRRLVATHHGETAHDERARAYEALAQTLYRSVDRVFAVSREGFTQLEGLGHVALLENFVALRPLPRQIPPDDHPRLLFLGRLSPEKGPLELLEAFAQLPHRRARLSVAGQGPLAPALRRRVLELGLQGRVDLLGFVSRVPELLACHDALVMPSVREGMPMAALEARAAGMPVLATRVGALPELIEDGVDGVLTELPGLPGALTRLLRRLPELREGAHERAAEILAHYSPARWAEHTTRHYRQLLEPMEIYA